MNNNYVKASDFINSLKDFKEIVFKKGYDKGMEDAQSISISEKDFAENANIAIGCLICGEAVELEKEGIALKWGHRTIYKICDKCKAAVLKMREQL